MVSEGVVVASFMMMTLSIAKGQLLQQPQFQISQLHTVKQPVHFSPLPNSQLLMMNTANTILNQDLGTPLQPGLLGFPVHLSEAVETVLDQESKIVGYNVPQGLSHQIVIPQQTISPLIAIHGTKPIPNVPSVHNLPRTVSIKRQHKPSNRNEGAPKSLSFPVLNSARFSNGNVVPVRASASLKSLLAADKQNKEVAYFNLKNKPFVTSSSKQSYSTQKLNPFNTVPTSTRFNPHANLYDDIPQNHPVPPPPSAASPPLRQTNSFDAIDISQLKSASPTPSYNFYLQLPPAPTQNDQPNFQNTQHHQNIRNSQVQNSGADYSPARPPPVPAPIHFLEESKDQQIIHMMPPIPYNQDFRFETKENVQPAESFNFPQQQQHVHYNRDAQEGVPIPPANVLVPPIFPEPEPVTVKSTKKSSQTSHSERPKETEEKGQSSRKSEKKSKASSKRKEKGQSDTDTSFSENLYEQVLSQSLPGLTNLNLNVVGYDQQSNAGYNQQTNSGYNQQSNTGYSQSNTGYQSANRPVVHKHIFVHSAPENYEKKAPRIRVIRPPGNQEKHVNIIFVKSPKPDPEPETVVQLPATDPAKTFVYVLFKKPNEEPGKVKFISPPTSKPPAPEIYFIRYGDKRNLNQGYPVPNLQSLYDNYGTLSNPQPQAEPVPARIAGMQPPAPFRRTPYAMAMRHKREKDYGLDVYAPLMSYSSTGQINEITQEEAELRRTKLDDFF